MTGQEFKEYILPINQKLFRYCIHYMGKGQEAEDILQEVYLKLWTINDKLKNINNLEAYAMTITKNLCLDRLKSKYYKIQTEIVGYDITNETNDVSPVQLTEYKDIITIIHRIIEFLPEQMHRVFYLRDIEELDFDEIMEITGLSFNNIRVVLSRARKIIKNELIKFHEFGTREY